MFLLKSPKNHTNACISKGSLKEQGVTEPINQSVSQSRLTVHLSPPSHLCVLFINIYCLCIYPCIFMYLCMHVCIMYVVCMYACMYVCINHPCLYGIY